MKQNTLALFLVMIARRISKNLFILIMIFSVQCVFVQNIEACIFSISKGTFNEIKGKRNLDQRDKLIVFDKNRGKSSLEAVNSSFQDPPFVVAKRNPWQSIKKIKSKSINYQSELIFHYTIPLKGVQYGAFIVRNINVKSDLFHFRILQSKITELNLFQIGVLPSVRGKSVADPLLPIKGEVKIEPGSTKMFFFKMEGERIGTEETIICVKNKDLEYEIKIEVKVEEVFNLKSGFDLNANNWAYLTYPMLKKRKQEAAQDLIEHHINTVVIPHSVLPNLKSRDFSKLIDYLDYFENIENILIYPNYKWAGVRNGYKGGKFLSEPWKAEFKSWYESLLSTVHRNHNKASIYFYPYDEVNKPANIINLKKFILWGKKAVPELKVYATFNDSKAIQELLPLVDVAQIYYRKAIKPLPKHDSDIWSYGIAATSRAISPYTYYRLMAWRAFKHGFEGIGFWNYAHEGGPGDRVNAISNPVQDLEKSYSVIYCGADKTIVSTRRWEAFKLGIEDYQIIKQYANKYGREKTLELVNKILIDKKNYSLADRVRDGMIDSLSN